MLRAYLPEATVSTESRWARCFGPAAITVVGLAMFTWTWMTWPDVLVDFGAQLYLPWRLAEGEVLYRDIACFHGPLSQYWHALLFRLFGPSLQLLVASNLFVVVLLTGLLYGLFHQIGSRKSATLAAMTFLLMFAFGQYVSTGNYNYVCPYTHETTHGLLLSLAALACAWRAGGPREPSGAWGAACAARLAAPTPPKWEETPDPFRWWFASGLLLGLAFLTRIEVFLAGAAGVLMLHASSLTGQLQARSASKCVFSRHDSLACAAGLYLTGPHAAREDCGGAFNLSGWQFSGSSANLTRSLRATVVGFILPPLLAIAGLSLAMPLEQAVGGVFSSWLAAMNGNVTGLAFFRRSMGIDHVAVSLAALAVAAAWHLAFLAPAAIVAIGAVRSHRGQTITSLAVAIAIGAVIWICRRQIPWFDLIRPLPLVLLLVGAAGVVSLLRGKQDDASRKRRARRLSFVALAVVLLGKMLLNARMYHYGFVLAMPATLLTVVSLVDWIPAALDRRGGSGRVFRLAALAWLLPIAGVYLAVQSQRMATRQVWVAAEGDAFRADTRGELVNRALQEIARRTTPEQTLVVLPEGIMLNYLARRASSIPYTNFMPTEAALFGETVILASLEAHPPDLIALVHKDTSEFGFPRFGRDYGRAIGTWISKNYHSVALYGEKPLFTDRFGIELWERNQENPDRELALKQ